MDICKTNDENQREKILQNAKALFMEEGFQKTTMAMIAEKSGVSGGLINYYFKKEEILGYLFHEFILYIRCFINRKLGKMVENQFQMHLLFNRIFFMKIFEEPAVADLYSLLREKELYLDITHNYVRSAMSSIILEFDLSVSPEMFRKLTVAEYGARKVLYQDIYKVSKHQISFDLTDFLSTISVRLAGVNPDLIQENIENINKIIRYLDLTEIHFLDDFSKTETT